MHDTALVRQIKSRYRSLSPLARLKNAGREWRPKGEPEEVKVHDFMDKQLGKAIPYGVFDLSQNEGWVSVGIDHDNGPICGASHRSVVAEDGCQTLDNSRRLARLTI